MHNQFVFLTWYTHTLPVKNSNKSLLNWIELILNNHEIFFGQRRKNRIVLLKTSGFESKYIIKIQNGRHKQKSGQHTLARQKIYKKQLLKTKAIVPKSTT